MKLENTIEKCKKFEGVVNKCNRMLKDFYEMNGAFSESNSQDLIISGQTPKDSKTRIVLNRDLLQQGVTSKANRSVYGTSGFRKPNTAVHFRNLSTRLNNRHTKHVDSEEISDIKSNQTTLRLRGTAQKVRAEFPLSKPQIGLVKNPESPFQSLVSSNPPNPALDPFLAPKAFKSFDSRESSITPKMPALHPQK